MANTDNPHGFGVVETPGRFVLVQLLAKVVGYGTALYPGDLVHRVADGSIEAASTNFTPGTTLHSGVNLRWGAASTATNHEVMVDPGALLEAQDNNDTDGIAAADLGLNIRVEANAGSATKLTSGHELDESTAAVGADNDFHMLELLQSPDNAHGSWARIIVKSNLHRYGNATVGV